MKSLKNSSTRLILVLLLTAIAMTSFGLVPALASEEAAAHGEGEGEGHGGKQAYDFVMRLINFIILAGFLVYFLRKPIKSFLFGRQKEIQDALNKAAEMHQLAQEKYDEYQQKIDQLDKEIESIIADFITDGEAEKERIIEQAKEESERIKVHAQLTGEHEIQKAKAVLRNEAALMAVKLAEELMIKNITPQDQKELIKDYLSRIGEVQ